MSSLITKVLPFAFLLICAFVNGEDAPVLGVHKINSSYPQEDIVLFHLKSVQTVGGGKTQGSYGDADIELEPSCPCSYSASLCDHTCCYCHLQCNLPEGVLTNRKWLQDVYGRCSPSKPKSLPNFKSRLFENSKRIEWMCNQRDIFMNSFKTTFYPILCVYTDNSIPLGDYYTINSVPTTRSNVKAMADKIPFSWDKSTTTISEIESNEGYSEADLDNEELMAFPMYQNSEYPTSEIELCESIETPSYITKDNYVTIT